MSIEPNEVYLGDGLYAKLEADHVRLRAPRGILDHVVYLEPEVFRAFIHFARVLPEPFRSIVNDPT